MDVFDLREAVIIIYPMNALANSQLDSIGRDLARDREARRLVRVRRFTGQETFEEKEQIREHPPHVLLTNYVMLEYLLTRTEDRRFLQRTLTSQVVLLVVDELHTYRGRQGADVALLLSRVRARCGNPDLTCIGTSATIATGRTRVERQARISEVASRLFGMTINPQDVVEEHLRQPIRVDRVGYPDAQRPRTNNVCERGFRKWRRRTRPMDGFGSWQGARNFACLWMLKENARAQDRDWMEAIMPSQKSAAGGIITPTPAASTINL